MSNIGAMFEAPLFKKVMNTSNNMRICANCGEEKKRSLFIGEAKYCTECKDSRKRIKSFDRKTYMKNYSSSGKGLQLKCAKQVVYNMKRMGILVPKPCEVCGVDKVEAHHCDYNKPYEVMWLCKEHHTEWHQNNEAKYVTKYNE